MLNIVLSFFPVWFLKTLEKYCLDMHIHASASSASVNFYKFLATLFFKNIYWVSGITGNTKEWFQYLSFYARLQKRKKELRVKKMPGNNMRTPVGNHGKYWLTYCYLFICLQIYFPYNNTCALTSRIIVCVSTVWNISKVYLEERFTANVQREPKASNLVVV